MLFIDTEASGLPVNWNLPYSTEGNWPSAVQVSWLLYTSDGTELKREDHYIRNTDFSITKEALEIHRITPEFLAENGQDRKQVMQLLANDLLQYKPLVIAHFVQLDYHVLSADFYRAGIENPLPGLPLFCTMMASRDLAWTAMQRAMRLDELYHYLFAKELQNQHNAAVDAAAVAESFFELRKRGEITEASITKQQKANIKNSRFTSNKFFAFLVPIAILMLIILIASNL